MTNIHPTQTFSIKVQLVDTTTFYIPFTGTKPEAERIAHDTATVNENVVSVSIDRGGSNVYFFVKN